VWRHGVILECEPEVAPALTEIKFRY
jgi:hypothetical protein